MVEVILPGTYVTVRDEALISAGQVVSGNIGIVGTAAKGELDKVQIIGSFSEAREIFGDTQDNDKLTLMRALEQIYNNGGRTVYAVRTAQWDQNKKQSYAVAAVYQTKDETNVALVPLQAKEPGTWGNDIRIKISSAPQDSMTVVTEELFPGTTKKLKRAHVVANSGLNQITVRQKSTGQVLSYQIVSGDPAGNKPEVKLDADGNLTFTTLASVAPVAEDTIVATYQVPAANSKQVELTYQTAKELYLIADGVHLAEQVNHQTKGSKLISVVIPSPIPSGWLKLPKDTSDKGELFGTGLDHTSGSNGENATDADYKRSLEKLENEIINIVLLAGQDVSNTQMLAALDGHLKATAEIKRERIGIIGSGGTEDVATIAGHPCNNDRLIFVAPGIQISPQAKLSGAYTAAAVAGLISSLPVQASPTNKSLTIPGLSKRFSSSQLENLVTHRVLVVEQRDGFRIVKGITTATNTAWHQITTRRIVDYAIYGVRSGCDPYIGKLNNSRVRGAMKATLDAFLTRMVQDEALISYELAVTATRPQEIAGEAIVTMTLRPTFSIDFIKVTMYLG